MGSFFSKILALPKLYTITGAVGIVVIGILGIHFLTRPAPAPETSTGISHVHISSVASLSSQTGPLPVIGKVTSQSEASILAQTSGEIVSLSRSIGDHVSAGQIIAQFENSSQQAALLQAQGAYDGAQAALSKASGTSSQNSSVSSAQAAQSAQNAQVAAHLALLSAYASLDDAIHTKADVLFSNPHSSVPQLNLTLSDNQLAITLQNERVALDPLLVSASLLASDTTNTDTDESIATMVSKAQTAGVFLTNLIEAINKTIPTSGVTASDIASYQLSIAAARTEVITALSSLTSAKSAYDSALSGATTAANSAGGGSANDIAAAEANVKQALGALNAAKANLEKTIIRSPISGTIVNLPITRGGYVSAFAQVADVSNPGALYIDTYVTPDDAKTLTVGNAATIEGSIPGVITFIAPALNPTTNKIELKVGIIGTQSALTDNDTVTVTLARAQGVSALKTAANTPIVIPIVAAKITPEGPFVFTVSASSTLEAKQVTLGPILGDKVTVLTGLTLESDIVTDARGLSDGQNVVVDSN